METDDVVTVPRHLISEVQACAHAIAEIVIIVSENFDLEIGAKIQVLVPARVWGFESPLSHQQLSSLHTPREPPKKCLRLAPVSQRVELSRVVPPRTRAAPHQNLTGPSARQIGVVILCRFARPTWGSIMCQGPANRSIRKPA